MLKVALSHDVDRIKKTYQYVTRTGRSILSLNFKGVINQIKDLKNKNQYWGFDDVIKIESDFGVKSTFFFLNESIPFKPFKPSSWKLSLGRYNIYDNKIVEIIRWLDSNGWEIGVHGSYQSYNNAQLLKHEKEVLEEIVGHEIFGIRQHYVNLNNATWQLQLNAGFKYDSTWGLKEEIGYRENRISSFSPFNNHFFVIPFTIMDSCFASTKDKWVQLDNLIELSIKNDALLVINWHTNNFSKFDFPNYKDDYIRIIKTCVDNNAKFYTLGEYYKEISSQKN